MIKVVPRTLTIFESFLITEILEECLGQMKIIGLLGQEEKMEVLEESEESDEDENKVIYFAPKLTPEKKLIMDLKFLDELLGRSIREMKNKHIYSSLNDCVRSYKQSQEECKISRERALKHGKMISEVKKTVATTKVELQKEIDDAENEIISINYELQKVKARTEMEKLYVSETIENEIEQIRKECENKEKCIFSDVESLDHRLQQEEEVDILLIEYRRHNEKELLELLDYWKRKFFDDYKALDGDLTTLKKYHKLNTEKFNTIAKELAIDEQYIEDDREYKQREKEFYELAQLKQSATIKIQAWWRGNMVRHQFGSFAKKKEKKEKKKKGGKKKKK